MYRFRFASRLLFVLVIAAMLLGLPLVSLAHEGDEDGNEASFRQYVDAINNATIDDIAPLLSDDFMNYRPGAPVDATDFLNIFRGAVQAFPDYHVSIEQLITEDDWLAARLIVTGTFENALQSPNGAIPPTGNPVRFQIIGLARFNDQHQMTEYWIENDQLYFLQQLGVIPTPPTADGTADAMSAATETPAMEATAAEGMEEQNKATMQRAYDELFNQRKLDLIAELYDPNYVAHELNGETLGTDRMRNTFQAYFAAMPDAEVTVDQLVAEGDLVASRITLRGTFTNELALGPEQVVLPTGQPIVVSANAFHRFNAQGQIADDWEELDHLSLLTQLGVLPAPQAADG